MRLVSLFLTPSHELSNHLERVSKWHGDLITADSDCRSPRRTIANAQTLYMRFHLFFPYREFSHVEVSLTTLYVSSKLHDTLKKPRDIILASYAVRFPQLIKRGQVDPAAVEANLLEGERNRVMSIERLVLETLCFKFKAEVGLGLVIKLGKAMGGEQIAFTPDIGLTDPWLQPGKNCVNRRGESLLIGELRFRVNLASQLIADAVTVPWLPCRSPRTS